jgi:hypothetical protein
MFSLQGWTALARILCAAGDDLWRYRASAGQGLADALNWMASHMDSMAAPQGEDTEGDRIAPLLADLARHGPQGSASVTTQAAAGKPVFHPDCAIPPFWIWRRP